MNIDEELLKTTFDYRENEIEHYKYKQEFYLLDFLKNGSPENVDLIVDGILSNKCGHLSNNPLRNIQYLFVAAMTLLTRFAIEIGMPDETAYNLSDLFIQKMDALRTPDEVLAMFKEALLDLQKKIQSLCEQSSYSPPVQEAVNYIDSHLHEEITIPMLCKHVALSPSYFSVLFKKETGLSVAKYIQQQRIHSAEEMLRYSNYSYLEISNYLAFSSHSHFISVFKKTVGMTPKEYRQKYYCKVLNEK